MVRFVNDIVELELFFVIMSFIEKDQEGQICLQKFTKCYVNITFV